MKIFPGARGTFRNSFACRPRENFIDIFAPFSSPAHTHPHNFIIYFDGENLVRLATGGKEKKNFVLAQIGKIGKSMMNTLEPEKCFGAMRAVCCCDWEKKRDRSVVGKSVQHMQKRKMSQIFFFFPSLSVCRENENFAPVSVV